MWSWACICFLRACLGPFPRQSEPKEFPTLTHYISLFYGGIAPICCYAQIKQGQSKLFRIPALPQKSMLLTAPRAILPKITGHIDAIKNRKFENPFVKNRQSEVPTLDHDHSCQDSCVLALDLESRNSSSHDEHTSTIAAARSSFQRMYAAYSLLPLPTSLTKLARDNYMRELISSPEPQYEAAGRFYFICKEGDVNAMKDLLSEWRDPAEPNSLKEALGSSYNYQSCSQAVRLGHKELVKYLVGEGYPIFCRGLDPSLFLSATLHAAESDDVEILDLFVEKGWDPSTNGQEPPVIVEQQDPYWKAHYIPMPEYSLVGYVFYLSLVSKAAIYCQTLQVHQITPRIA
jgi:hypothetical protein